jgi:hypothetical protein
MIVIREGKHFTEIVKGVCGKVSAWTTINSFDNRLQVTYASNSFRSTTISMEEALAIADLVKKANLAKTV